MKKLICLLLASVMLLSCAGAYAYTAGSYEAEAKGFGGAVKVIVTVDGEKITDVTVTGESETAGIGTNAIEQLPAKIIEANGADVDGVAGATVTSDAIKAAVKEAIAAAKGEAVDAAIAFVPCA